MNIRRSRRRKPLVPINSMSDIAFLLLIFIMLISLINYRQEIKIDYPEGEYQEVTQADKNLEIWVDQGGRIFYDGAQVTLTYLEGVIAEAAAENPAVRIHILGDKNTAFKNVNGILETLKLLNHRAVSLVVKEPSN